MSTARRVHVTCGSSKKVVTLSELASVQQQVFDIFAVSTSAVLQIWDEEFKDFVDVDSEIDIKNLSRLNVSFVTASDAPGNPNMLSPSSSSTVLLALTPVTTPSTSAPPYPSTPSSTLPWPIVIQVPVHLFSPDLRKVLESGCPLLDLKAKFKKQIQEAYFYDMSQFGFYPPMSKYKEAAMALVTMFPNLRDQESHTDGYECWAHSISEKFRNERRSMTDIPEVVIRKKKLKLSKSEEKTVNVYCLPMFLPSRPPGEDDASIEAHLAWMVSESVKSVKNKQKIVRLMDITFADRREKIVTEKCTMGELKEMYPLLYSSAEIRAEYCRLAQRESDSDSICAAFQEISEHVFSKLHLTHRKKTDILVEALRVSSSIVSEDEKKTFLSIKALLGIVYMLKEDVSFVFVEDGKVPQDCGTPVIVFRGDVKEASTCHFRIDVGGMEVCAPENFFDSINCLLCCYYAFNFEYAKKAAASLMFLQSFVVKHKDSVPMPRSVTALKMRLRLV